jgi:hypothetical protein
MIEVKGVNGTVAFDGRTVTIHRSGVMARATVGKGTKSIPVGNVVAVQWKPASRTIRGFIQFTVAGGNEGRSRFGRQSIDAAKDENSVLFGWTQRAEFEALRAAVEAAISAGPTPAPDSASVADELAKLNELRAQGVLSDAEFDAAKARLLG